VRPADLPDFSSRPHGTRSRYVAGCRCDACRAANARAYHERRARAAAAAAELAPAAVAVAPQQWTAPDGTKRTRIYARACPGIDGQPCPARSRLRKDSGTVCGACRDRLVWNGLVPAGPALTHLNALSARGVGYKAVAAACDVGNSILSEIRTGQKTQIRRQTERRILAVDETALADGALVPARTTWRLVAELQQLGWTKARISAALGHASPALQIRKRMIRASTAAEVKRLHARVLARALEKRLRLLATLDGLTYDDIREDHPGVWPGTKLLRADMAILSARRAASGLLPETAGAA
jgi:hypothetical protein